VVVVEGPGVGTAGVTAEHGKLLDWASGLLLGRERGGGPDLVQGVNKVAAGPVGAKADAVVGAAEVCLVFGVAGNIAHVLRAVSELAFVSVLASAVLLIRTAHLSFVSVGILDSGGGGHGGPGVSLALAPVKSGSA